MKQYVPPQTDTMVQDPSTLPHWHEQMPYMRHRPFPYSTDVVRVNIGAQLHELTHNTSP